MNHPIIRSEDDYNNFPSTKKEDDDGRPKPNPSSRHWSNYKNPRIVRVSRAFGGKDRHSKVCTVRGLRDRRIRLSVPTAIQLYDLQDRLGLSQPSKVVDWLLDATKNDIDKLPPLPIFPLQHLQNEPTNNLTTNYAEKPTTIDHHHEAGSLIGPGFVAQNLFPHSNSYHNFGYNSYQHNFHWEPPNLSLSQSGMYAVPNVADAGSEMYFYPSLASLMPSANFPSSMESDQLRQMNTAAAPLLPTTLNLISPAINKPFGSKSSVYNTLQESDQARRFQNK